MKNPRNRIARPIMRLSKGRQTVRLTISVNTLELGARVSQTPANPADQYASAQYERLLRLMRESHVSSS